MTLAIRSNQDLDVLERWLRENSVLQLINNRNLIRMVFRGKPLTHNLGAIVRYKVDTDTKSVMLVYQLPGVDNFINTKPMEYITHFVNSQHKGGL